MIASTDLRTRLDAAKAKVLIPDAWRVLELPDPPSRMGVTRSPFREDRHPSFSIFSGGRAFRDHAHLEHRGDVVQFVQIATGCDRRAAIEAVLCWAGDTAPVRPDRTRIPLPPIARRPLDVSKRLPDKPPPLPPSLADAGVIPRKDAERVAASRGLPPSACYFLRWSGNLLPWYKDGELVEWHLADAPDWPEPDEDGPRFPAAARVIEARRLDRQPFHCGAKAWTLPGSRKDWPVGLSALAWPSHSWRLVLAVEGGPDLLAAHALIEHLRIHGVLPVAILSRGTRRLRLQASALLHGHHVHVIPHNDPPKDGRDFRNGRATAEAWARDLFFPAGAARVTVTTLESLARPDLQPAKDLCDALEHGGFERNAGKTIHLIP